MISTSQSRLENNNTPLRIENLDPKALEDAGKQATLEAIRHVEKHYRVNLPRPEINFGLKGKSAGQFRYTKINKFISGASKLTNQELRFNAEMLHKYTKPFFEELIPHEVSHYAAYNLYGLSIKPHGREWKFIMSSIFQVQPKVTHQFELSPAKRRGARYTYSCGCPEHSRYHELSGIRHKRIQTQAAVYKCRKCGQPLSFSG